MAFVFILRSFQFFWCCKTSQENESRKIHWNAWRYYLLPWWTTSGGNICCLRKQKTLTSLPRIVIRLDYFQADLRHRIAKFLFTPTQVWATPVLLRVETSQPRSQTTPAGGDPWPKVEVKKNIQTLVIDDATCHHGEGKQLRARDVGCKSKQRGRSAQEPTGEFCIICHLIII